MQKKYSDFGKLWAGEQNETDDKAVEQKAGKFDYSNIDSVTLFEGTHPAVMKELVKSEDWDFDIDVRKKNFKNIKHHFLYFLWTRFGIRPFEYSNYIKV